MNYRKKALFVVMATLCFHLTLFAQSVSLNRNDISVKQAMNELKAKSGYSFVYASGDLNTNQVVSIQATQLDEAIKQILQGQNVSYEVKGKNIIIKKVVKAATGEQKKQHISGRVTDVAGEPIIGANVVVKEGVTHGVITDLDGNFSLEVLVGGAFEVSYIGYTTQNIPVKDKSVYHIKMIEDSKTLDEVVVVGYISQKKGLLTGSVVSVNMTEAMEEMPTTAAANILVGRLAGVDISTPKGIPGENPGLSIRTKSSLNDQEPLYVIDGIARGGGDFNNLSPNEIENITILKDAAAAAVYGARSAGGVVLVTTKRGKISKPVFNYSYSFGFDTRTANVDMTDGVQTGEIYNRVYAGENKDWFWSQEELDYIKTINKGWGYDQLETVWRNPTIQTHNLSVNGGTEKAKYFAGVSYVKQEGFLKPLNYDKFNFRLNATVDVTDHFQFFAGMALTNNKKSKATFEGAESLYTKLLRWQPDQPVYTDGGQLVDYSWVGNVGGELNGAGGYSKEYNLKPQIVLDVTYKLPIEGLKLKASYGSNWSNDRTSDFRTTYQVAKLKREGQFGHILHTDDASIIGWGKSSQISKDYLEKKSTWGSDYQLNFQLNYNRIFKEKHSVQGVFAFEKNESTGASVHGGRESFPVFLTDQFWAASGARGDTWGGGDTDWTDGRASFVGQFVYAYDDKYLLNFSFREDGSMKFAPDQRWGFFPAGSLGWVVSKESFFHAKNVEYLKLRGSAGLVGNDAVGGWQWQESYQQGNSAYFGTDPSRSVGIKYGSVVNPLLTWEKSLSYNAAVDMNFFKHWNTTVEYWFRKTYDILKERQASLPGSFSLAMPKENYAQVNAQGFDFTLGYNNRWGEFDFHGNLAMSYGWNKNMREDYAENAKWIDIPVGKSLSNVKGYYFDQIIRTQEQLDRFNQEHPGYRIGGNAPELGMMVYKDLSGPDGKPDQIIDSWDKVMLIKNNFPINYGLNLGGSWKGLSVDLMFNGKLKNKKSFKNLSEGVEWNRMWTQWYDNSWTPENTGAFLPQRKGQNITYQEESDFWWKDANFIRLKYINVAYTLPKPLYKGVFDRVKLFFSGNNLFVLSGFDYYDPEMENGFDFPAMRSFNFGIDVTF